MKRTTLALIVAFVVAACATPSSIQQPIMALEGKNIKEAIQALGIPHNEQSIAGMRVFSYSYRQIHISGRDFFCDIRLVTNKDDLITKVEIQSNSMFYCPRLD